LPESVAEADAETSSVAEAEVLPETEGEGVTDSSIWMSSVAEASPAGEAEAPATGEAEIEALLDAEAEPVMEAVASWRA
jgi:hypothetical protein